MVDSSKPKGRDLDRDPDTGQREDHLDGIAGGAFAGGAAGRAAGAASMGAATGTIAGGPLGTVRGTSRLDWADAREATRDAYDRLAHLGEREAPAGTRRGDD